MSNGFRVSFFSGDTLIACYFYAFQADAEQFINAFLKCTDPLFGKNDSCEYVLNSDFTICLHGVEDDTSKGELISRYIIYKG